MSEWLSSSPDLKLVENLWWFVKMILYEGGKQYTRKTDQWEAIKTTLFEINSKKKLTKPMDNRLLVIEKTY